jgi:hypothetical protein
MFFQIFGTITLFVKGVISIFKFISFSSRSFLYFCIVDASKDSSSLLALVSSTNLVFIFAASTELSIPFFVCSTCSLNMILLAT